MLTGLEGFGVLSAAKKPKAVKPAKVKPAPKTKLTTAEKKTAAAQSKHEKIGVKLATAQNICENQRGGTYIPGNGPHPGKCVTTPSAALDAKAAFIQSKIDNMTCDDVYMPAVGKCVKYPPDPKTPNKPMNKASCAKQGGAWVARKGKNPASCTIPDTGLTAADGSQPLSTPDTGLTAADGSQPLPTPDTGGGTTTAPITDAMTPTCGPGQHWDDNLGVCVNTAGKPQCPPGTKWNDDDTQCECPDGFPPDEDTGTCSNGLSGLAEVASGSNLLLIGGALLALYLLGKRK